jgi:hypothetical protein
MAYCVLLGPVMGNTSLSSLYVNNMKRRNKLRCYNVNERKASTTERERTYLRLTSWNNIINKSFYLAEMDGSYTVRIEH